MIQECASIIFFFQVNVLPVKTNGIPIYNLQHVVLDQIKPHSRSTSVERPNTQYCFTNNKWIKCTSRNNYYNTINSFTKKNIEEKFLPRYNARPYNKIRQLDSNMKSYFSEAQSAYRRFYMTNPTGMINIRSLPHFYGSLPAKTYPMHRPGISHPFPRRQVSGQVKHNINTAWNMPHLHAHTSSGSAQVNSSSSNPHKRLILKPPVTMAVSGVPQQIIAAHKNMTSIFTQSLDRFERQFLKITFTKLTTISPADRQENGMSFVQSGFFLLLTLMTLSKEVDSNTRAEIDKCIGFKVSDVDSVSLVRHFITSLPNSSDKLKLRQSSRLVIWPGKQPSPRFEDGAAEALMLHVERFNGTETADTIATILNHKVEIDSGGAIHNTFDEDDVSGGVTAVLVTTLYVRGRWRAGPTVLNGTRPFRDADDAPQRTVRMIRINDIMKYADLKEWDAQALEISYATPGLTLMMLIPRGNSLKSLVEHVSNTTIGDITAKMKTLRVAATVPIYTLRMTLLLPNKLQAMGIPRLVDVSNVTQASSLRLSHAVQRIMFWAEAGRNAYKDDGIEWDQAPELEVVVDRPYTFFVRWHNATLINGNFVL